MTEKKPYTVWACFNRQKFPVGGYDTTLWNGPCRKFTDYGAAVAHLNAVKLLRK